MNQMKTYDEIRRVGNLDGQDRAWLKHKITARDKWLKEAVERKTLEFNAGSSGDWAARAQAHADKLNQEIEKLVSRAGIKAADQEVKRLEEKVSRLERELIAARLELSAARRCLICGKTGAQGCKADSHPYTCDGKVSK